MFHSPLIKVLRAKQRWPPASFARSYSGCSSKKHNFVSERQPRHSSCPFQSHHHLQRQQESLPGSLSSSVQSCSGYSSTLRSSGPGLLPQLDKHQVTLSGWSGDTSVASCCYSSTVLSCWSSRDKWWIQNLSVRNTIISCLFLARNNTNWREIKTHV